MTSLRHRRAESGLDHSDPPPSGRSTTDDALLDAARAGILDVGWKRSTLTDVARRAGVSRMTIYRRWPDMETLLADLMTREWSGLVEPSPHATDTADPVARLAAGVASTVAAMRANELFHKIVTVDPELLLPYLLVRQGRTQAALLSLLEAEVADGQRAGVVRAGDPSLLARSVLLAASGFVFSAPTVTDDRHDVASLDQELRELVERYLRPIRPRSPRP
jgi:AcrR family transcriptional regulator